MTLFIYITIVTSYSLTFEEPFLFSRKDGSCLFFERFLFFKEDLVTLFIYFTVVTSYVSL